MYKKLTWTIALSAMLMAACGNNDEATNTGNQNQGDNQEIQNQDETQNQGGTQTENGTENNDGTDTQNGNGQEAGPRDEANEGVENDTESTPIEGENEIIGDDQYQHDMPDAEEFKDDKNLNK